MSESKASNLAANQPQAAADGPCDAAVIQPSPDNACDEHLHRIRKEIADREAINQAIIDAVPDGVISIDFQGLIVSFNPAAERIFGQPANRMFGRNADVLMPENCFEAVARWMQQNADDATSDTTTDGRELLGLRGDGTTFPMQWTMAVAHCGGRHVFTAIARDITAQKELQEDLVVKNINLAMALSELKATQTQLVQNEKMEAIGHLAAGIAHEINTPIQYVGDNTRFVRDSVSDLLKLIDQYGTLLASAKECRVSQEQIAAIESAIENLDLEFFRAEIPKAIEQTLDGVKRVADIVRAMKDFSHPGDEEKTFTDLNKAIESTITVCRNRWKYVADLETDFQNDLPPVPCLAGEFNQVILNIIVNAADAIGGIVGDGGEGKGLITVSTRQDGEWVEIRLSDTGGGIPEEIHQKIFDPFFTTKKVGKGTGQGLAISHDVIVNKHGGTIDLDSEPGVGTTFIIRIPIDTGLAGQQKEAA